MTKRRVLVVADDSELLRDRLEALWRLHPSGTYNLMRRTIKVPAGKYTDETEYLGVVVRNIEEAYCLSGLQVHAVIYHGTFEGRLINYLNNRVRWPA